MNEARLLFARDKDGALTYRIATSWGGDAGEPQPFVPFLKDDDDEDLRWYLEDYMDLPMGGAKVRAERIEQSLAEWGRKLPRSASSTRGTRRGRCWTRSRRSATGWWSTSAGPRRSTGRSGCSRTPIAGDPMETGGLALAASRRAGGEGATSPGSAASTTARA